MRTINSVQILLSFAFIVVWSALTTQAAEPASSFDYHTVRGRQARTSHTGVYEGEVDFALRGKSRVQGMAGFGPQWSGNAHLLWDGKVGDSLDTEFQLEESGTYDIEIMLTVAPDYGQFEMTFAGRIHESLIDLYDPRVALAPVIRLEDRQLKKGNVPLTFKMTGGNPRSRKFRGVGYLMGLDYIRLIRKDAIPETEVPKDAAPPKSSATENAPVLDDVTFQRSLAKFCGDCHMGEEAEGQIDLAVLKNRASTNVEVVRKMRNAIAHHEMPPKDSGQPSLQQRSELVATLDTIVREHLQSHPRQATVVMRRMNRLEYNNAVRDLLKLRGDIYPLPEKMLRAGQPYFNPASGKFPNSVVVGNRTLGKNQVERQILTGVSPFAIDLQSEGGFNNRGSELSVSPILLESFLKLGRSIVQSPQFDGYCGLTNSLFTAPREDSLEDQAAHGAEQLKILLAVSFREDVQAATAERYVQYFAKRLRESGNYRQSMKQVVAAILASPKFIYLAEADSANDDVALSAYELATRLSFFLWSSIPDQELLQAARDKTLLDSDVLDAQVRRMLEDPRSQAISHNFARQWLRLDQLTTAVPDFERFPEYYSRIGCEQWKFGLQTAVEPLLLFESIMVEDRSIMLLVDCNYSYRSDELRSWYRDDNPFSGKQNRNRFNTNQQRFSRRTLEDRRQGGVITSAATLTMTSSPLRTSPISRGAWVATVIFNRPPPPPPDVVPPIEADDKAIESQGLTLRERLEQHQVNASCKACHSKIDPLGFALENFDAVGRWRDTYKSGLAIDSSGVLFGQAKFNNIIQLKAALLQNPEWFMRAFSEHLLSYALGRELQLEDVPDVEQIVAKVMDDRGQFTTVVREIVQSRPFRYRVRQPEHQ